MTRLSFGKPQNVPAIGKISARSLTRRNSRASAAPRDSIINIRARVDRCKALVLFQRHSRIERTNESLMDLEGSHRQFSTSPAARQIPRKSENAPLFGDPLAVYREVTSTIERFGARRSKSVISTVIIIAYYGGDLSRSPAENLGKTPLLSREHGSLQRTVSLVSRFGRKIDSILPRSPREREPGPRGSNRKNRGNNRQTSFTARLATMEPENGLQFRSNKTFLSLSLSLFLCSDVYRDTRDTFWSIFRA